MSVIIPPILLAKAIGISRRLLLMLPLIAILTTMGIIKATVPVLLTKAPIKAVTSITKIRSFTSLSPAKRKILLLIIFANPVWKIAPPTTNSPIIITTTLSEKPDKACSGVNMPKSTKSTKAHIATKSERTFPLIKNKADIKRMIRVVYITN